MDDTINDAVNKGLISFEKSDVHYAKSNPIVNILEFEKVLHYTCPMETDKNWWAIRVYLLAKQGGARSL